MCFIKKITPEFIIIAVYVNDLNIIGTHKEILKTMMYLMNEFEMKDFKETNIIFIYSLNTFKVEYFYINQTKLRRS